MGNNDLFYNDDVIDTELIDEDVVTMAFNGGAGSGKSLMLANQALYDMLVLKRTVWSNMKVHTGKQFLKRGYRYQETKPLDINLIYMLDKGVAQGTIILDEIQNLSDSRTSLSLKNRLLNGMMYQRRKRQLRIFYSIKQNSWADKRLTFETDIRCDCLNLAKTPWGRENSVKGGRLIRLELWDLSGAVTGYPSSGDRYAKPYKKMYFKGGRNLYDCFDSWATVDLAEIYTNVRLDMKDRIISNKPQLSDISPAISEVVNDLKSRDIIEIPCDTLRDVLRASGVEANDSIIGQVVKQLGIGKKQKSDGSRVYDFANAN